MAGGETTSQAPISAIPRIVDGPLPRPASIPFDEWWDRIRRGEREIVLPSTSEDDAPRPPPRQAGGVSALRERILASSTARRAEQFEVPEWGCTVELRPLDAGGITAYTVAVRAPQRDGKFVSPARIMATAAALCCYDPGTGRRVFTLDDVEALEETDGAALARVFQKANELCGFLEEALGGAKPDPVKD